MKTNTLDFDAQALREKILDLAMRGKLVPQDPNDEPASVLLGKIKAEKEELIKAKKIKKTKSLPEITDDEKPFEIPDSWEWVRIGELSRLITKGTTPKGGKDVYISEGIKFYRAENVKDNKLLLKPMKYISKSIHQDELKRSKLVAKDILVTIAGTLGNVAIVEKENIPGNCNQAVAICRPIDVGLIDEKFLSYALSNEAKNIVKRKKTTSIPNLTLQHVTNAIVPFPPLSEQSRIAAKIAQLFALLRKVESLLK
ncbi:restriction endonuclease subunit S [Limosilactobacillus reuteri]